MLSDTRSVFQKPALCQGTTLQAAEKPVDRVSKGRFVSGHGFSRAVNAAKSRWPLGPGGMFFGNPDLDHKPFLIDASARTPYSYPVFKKHFSPGPKK
jgi:hypothetical protein